MPNYDQLDRDTLIRLLQRRDAERQLGLVWECDELEAERALRRWDEGDGFYPDFVVSLEGRDKPDGVALLEVKGDFLWNKDSEVEKAAARHPDYGDVFMVGRARGARDFIYLRKLGGKLDNGGAFDVARMRW
jgi:hypothetical protein